jgi:hypothetical protein
MLICDFFQPRERREEDAFGNETAERRRVVTMEEPLTAPPRLHVFRDTAARAGTISTREKGGVVERKRRFTEEQARSLEPKEKEELARELGLQPRQVAIWFQNKRTRWRSSKQLEHDYADLRAHYDALRDRVESLKQEKVALAAQVRVPTVLAVFFSLRNCRN